MLQTTIEGYFTQKQCESIKSKMQGKTFFNFDISYSNFAGNCTLIVKSDNDEEYTSQDLKEMFIHCCLSQLSES